MKNKRGCGISFYFILGAVAVTALTTALFVYLWANDAAQRDRKLIAERDKLFAHTLAQSVRTYVFDNMDILRQVAGSLEAVPFTTEAVQPIVDNAVTNSRAFFTIFVTDKDGVTVAAFVPAAATESDRHPTGLSLADREYFKKLVVTRDVVVSDAIISKITPRPTVAIALPLLDANKNFAGMVVGGLSIEPLYRLAEAALGSEIAVPVVIDSVGQVIVHSDENLIARQRSLAGFEPAKRTLAGQEGFLDHFIDQDGVSRSAAYAPIKEFGWGVWIAQDTQQFDIAYKQVVSSALLWWLSTLLGVIVLFYVLAKVLFRPLDSISSQAIDIVSNHDFSKQVRVPALLKSTEVTKIEGSMNSLIEQVHKSYADQERVLKIKSEFLRIATHAFRSPLTVLQWTLDSIIDDVETFPKKHRLMMRDLYESTQRLAIGFENLFTGLDIQEQTIHVTLKKGDVSATVRQVLKKVLPLAERNGLTIESELRRVMTGYDEPKLKRVMEAIITNAIFYNRKNGKIDVALFKDGDDIVFSVKDSGIGIAKEDLPHAFEPFFRGKRAASKFTDGLGLGLFIAKSFVEAHHGKITIESEEGEGTTVTVRLPADVTFASSGQ